MKMQMAAACSNGLFEERRHSDRVLHDNSAVQNNSITETVTKKQLSCVFFCSKEI